MHISPELWRQISPLIDEALAMNDGVRRAWLAQLDETHPRHASLLREMFTTHETAERRRELETVPKLAPPPPHTSDFAPGMRVGPYVLSRLLGTGGMGEVWLARQADGRVERDVALKLPLIHRQGAALRRRFTQERDILARLAHPNITRLIDAGVSDAAESAGQLFLAMEYVDGVTLTDFAAAQKLTIEQRLALFRRILDAVAHAHRHLVVHRDLKPANILVDRSGDVKLLDFGIAKLLDDDQNESGEATRLGGRVMTLRYAAPEQLSQDAGQSVSTTTDVYALGVILHELVTGQSPYRVVREERPLNEAAMLREETARPSSLAVSADVARERGLMKPKALARRIGGDLDAIILKAMRKSPAERYASVEQFDADIARHLEQRPVEARAGTWRYLAGRFAARHKLPLAAAAGVVIAATAGVVMVERERQIAQKHFSSVRQLANTFMFDIHDEIADLPGALKAREKLVSTTLQYLDSLSTDARDPALIAELAVAYRKVGDIQGVAASANLGMLAASLANYEKSRALFEALGDYKSRDIGHLREQYWLRSSLARAYVMKSDPRWQENSAATVKLGEQRAAAPAAAPRDRSSRAVALAEHALLSHNMRGTSREADAMIEQAITLQERLALEIPDEKYVREMLAGVYDRAAVIFTENRPQKAIPRAIEIREKARALLAKLESEFPDDRTYAVSWVGIQARLAENYAQTGRYAEATEAIDIALQRQRAMVKADPANANDRVFVVFILSRAAYIALQKGDHETAIRKGREAITLFATMPGEQQESMLFRNWLADAKEHTARAIMATPGRGRAMLSEACTLMADTVAFYEALYASQPVQAYKDTIAARAQDVNRCRSLQATAAG